MKCYSTPKPPKPATKVSDATSKRIDEAFERAYRSVYMGQDSLSEGKQLIESAYEASMERKRNASKPGNPVGDSRPQEATEDADLSPYERYVKRKANAWKEGK